MAGAKKNWLETQINRLPLEEFSLPTDGRQWQQAARTTKSLLMRIARNGNPDGTFSKEVPGKPPLNMTPSRQTLMKEFSRATIKRHVRRAWLLGLLQWTDEAGGNKFGRGHRKICRITLPVLPEDKGAQVQDERGSSSNGEQVPDSEPKGAHLGDKGAHGEHKGAHGEPPKGAHLGSEPLSNPEDTPPQATPSRFVSRFDSRVNSSSSSSSGSGDRKIDDDAQAHAKKSPEKTNGKTVSDNWTRWATDVILLKAKLLKKNVRVPSAYVARALPSFFANRKREEHDWLLIHAGGELFQAVQRHGRQDEQRNRPFLPIHECHRIALAELEKLVQEHDLLPSHDLAALLSEGERHNIKQGYMGIEYLPEMILFDK